PYESATSTTSIPLPRYSFYVEAPESMLSTATIRFPTPPHHPPAKPPTPSSSPSNVRQQQIRCTKCSQKFGRRQDLMRHLRVTHSVFFCEDCKRQFGSSGHVNEHLNSGKCENAKKIRRRGRPPLMLAAMAVCSGYAADKGFLVN
ncbi:hypothetical protein HK100_003731, partial [Physocladia obscura]